jgi:hypothetical protein
MGQLSGALGVGAPSRLRVVCAVWAGTWHLHRCCRDLEVVLGWVTWRDIVHQSYYSTNSQTKLHVFNACSFSMHLLRRPVGGTTVSRAPEGCAWDPADPMESVLQGC